MLTQAPAKLNLFLHVLAREASGYHQLETLFCALDLADELEIRASDGEITLEVEGAELGGAEENLVYRAARAYGEARGAMEAVHLRLRKRIPVGGGLGGGSSDAAATLRVLDRMQAEGLGDERLLALGASLGSDVPFFLCGSPLALGWGRGGRLLPLEALPAADVLLAVPKQGMATAEAFEALARARRTGYTAPARVLRAERMRGWEDVARIAHNDFEPVVFARMPELGAAKALLQRHGAAPALLSGSGATVFGVFSDPGRLEDAAAALAQALPSLRLIRTRTAAPPPGLPFG